MIEYKYITERNDRVAYIYYMLEEIKTRAFIQKFIEQLGITSRSTAERIIKKMDMNKKLFLATYTPAKNDREAVDEVLGVNTDKVSSEVKEELTIENKESFEEKTEVIFNEKVYGFIYTGKRTEHECILCDLCSSKEKCICEVGAESGTTFMGYFKYLKDYNIEEVCKDRDDKEEEIRLLKLELHKYKNDLNIVLDNRQKLECLLHDSVNSIELNPKYGSLYKVLIAAYNQAENGKGKERHQLNNEEPFENQKICEIARRLSVDYNLGQAVKKIYESKRLTEGRDIAELYGAINYIAAAIIVKQEEKNE